jgi:hypothetical protein
VKSGGKELALELEKKGYGWVEQELAEAADEPRPKRHCTRHGPEQMKQTLNTLSRYAELLPAARIEGILPGEERLRALERFRERGFPTTRHGSVDLHERRADRSRRSTRRSSTTAQSSRSPKASSRRSRSTFSSWRRASPSRR